MRGKAVNVGKEISITHIANGQTDASVRDATLLFFPDRWERRLAEGPSRTHAHTRSPCTQMCVHTHGRTVTSTLNREMCRGPTVSRRVGRLSGRTAGQANGDCRATKSSNFGMCITVAGRNRRAAGVAGARVARLPPAEGCLVARSQLLLPPGARLSCTPDVQGGSVVSS